MSNLLKKMGYALITPQKVIVKIVGGDKSIPNDISMKYQMDRYGKISVNPLNTDIQAAFRKNVSVLSHKKV